MTKTVHDTHLHRLLAAPAVLDQRLYGVIPVRGIDVQDLAAVLQSRVTALSTEVVGATALGQGALDLPVRVVRLRLRVPDPRGFPARERQALRAAFESLCQREIGPVTQELHQPDRRALDAAVLRGLGLPPERWLDALGEALIERMTERLDLAGRSR